MDEQSSIQVGDRRFDGCTTQIDPRDNRIHKSLTFPISTPQRLQKPWSIASQKGIPRCPSAKAGKGSGGCGMEISPQMYSGMLPGKSGGRRLVNGTLTGSPLFFWSFGRCRRFVGIGMRVAFPLVIG